MTEALNKYKKKIGLKECRKAIEAGKVAKAFIAQDADQNLLESFVNLCKDKSVEIIYMDSMKNLGKACGIDVGASTVVLIKEE